MHLLTDRLRRHRILLGIMAVTFILLSGALYWNYTSTLNHIKIYYLKTFEKKTYSNLALFHTQTTAAFTDYFERSLQIIVSLTHDAQFQVALDKKDTKKLFEILERQRTVNQRFDNLAIFDKNGTATVIAAFNPEFNKNVGKNYSYQPYFKATMQTKAPYTGKIFAGASPPHEYLIPFSAPLLDDKGEVQYMVVGTTRLISFKSKVNAFIPLEDFTVLLTDGDGNIILKNGQAQTTKQNIAADDRVMSQLIDTNEPVLEEEINYEGMPVFAQGSPIDLGNGNRVYSISYYPKSQVDQEMAGLEQQFKNSYSGVIFRDFLFLLLTYGVVAWLLKYHEQGTHLG